MIIFFYGVQNAAWFNYKMKITRFLIPFLKNNVIQPCILYIFGAWKVISTFIKEMI